MLAHLAQGRTRPEDVETGIGAEKLEALKDQLKKRHTMSFFTTPEDLHGRIMHDVPAQFESMGVVVTSGLVKAEEVNDREVLRNFELLLKLFSDRQITIEFQLQKTRAVFAEDCTALHLEHGATVTNSATLSSGQSFSVYGEREIALALLELPKNSMVKARANTAFGICTQVLWTDDAPIPEMRSETGLIITEILDIEPPKGGTR